MPIEETLATEPQSIADAAAIAAAQIDAGSTA